MSRRGSFEGGAAFNYTPRINNKPNAQGTLFQVNPDQRTPESRQPRGYSPERFREVTEAVGAHRRFVGGRGYADDAPNGYRYSIYPGHAETLARSMASLARSTVPLSDITRPKPDDPATQENPDLHVGVWPNGESNEGELGHYSRPGSTAIKQQGRIALSSGRADDKTVLHEIGHHVDYMQHGLPYSTPAEQGRAEGFADAYAHEHARTPGYKQRRAPVEPRPENWNLQPGMDEYGAQPAFHEAYRTQRNLQPKQFDFMEDTRQTMGAKTYPKGHIQGQEAILQKSASRDRDPDAQWVNGRPPMKVRWEYADWTGLRGY